jgi:hypothetical protein
MKKLFFLLVVVNLVIWLWGQRDQIARVADRSAPALGTLRLLDDAEVAARREAAAAPAAEPPPVAVALAESAPMVADASAPPAAAPTEDPPIEPARPLPEVQPAATPPQDLVSSPVEPPGAAEPPAVAMAPPAPAPAEPTDTTAPAPQDEPVAAAPVDAVASAEVPSAVEPSVPQPVVQAPVLAEPVAAEPVVPTSVPQPSVPMPIVPESPATQATPELPPPSATASTESTAATDDRAPASAPAVEAHTAPASPPVPPVESREVEYLCESIGPFAERPAAIRVQAGIQAPLRGATIREERSPRATRHWVLAPVQPSKDATSEYLANLGQAGVRDAWRIPNGPLAGRLAVGVFQSAENARKHADMLASKGVASEVVAPKDLEPIRVYWVDYERPADIASPSAGPAPRKVVPRACGRVAGPGGLP